MIKDFSPDILKQKDKLILLDFFATWCIPCKQLAPLLENLNIDTYKIDVGIHDDLAQKFNIRSVPTLMLYKNEKVVDFKTGAISKYRLEEWINVHLSV